MNSDINGGEAVKYDFESIMDRRGMDAIAVDSLGSGNTSFVPGKPDEGFDVIPMWVADMNFPACPTIVQAMIDRASHPAYGYFEIRKEYYDEIIKWHEVRNKAVGLTAECIGYENGVLGGVISALNVLCSKGDSILVHSPTYIGFTNVLKNNGYNIVLSPLRKDEDGRMRMDFEDMEKKLRENKIHAALFCSPHNPGGRVWSGEEILQFTELCRKYDTYIISDEIWADLTLFGNKHIPTQSVSEDAKNRTVALYAPSKTFNLAGLVGSYHIIYNRRLRNRIRKESSLCHYNNINLLSMYALIGAYSPQGYEWLDELLSILSRNIDYACSFIGENFPDLDVPKPEGTYMMFVDCGKYCERTGKTLDDVLAAAWRVGVAVQDGRPFHGECHIRMNFALPFSRVKEALNRLKKYVFTYDF